MVASFFTPADVPVTLTEKLHEAPSARVAPDRLTVPPPAVAVMVPPPHEPVRPFGVDTTSPDGRVSEKPIPLELPLPTGLVMVKASEVEPLSGMVAAPKAIPRVGGTALTARVAVAVLPVPPSVELMLDVVLTL